MTHMTCLHYEIKNIRVSVDSHPITNSWRVFTLK